MRPRTRALWEQQDRHPGDRERLLRAVAAHLDAGTVLYPGCYVDLAPSFVWPSVTYVDTDDRAARFFADDEGTGELIAQHPPSPARPELRFLHRDYTDPLGLPDASFDLLLSLYAGLVSDRCTRYLRPGGALLVNPSHGDAALDPRYRLTAVVLPRADDYLVTDDDLERYLVPRRPGELTADHLRRTGRGVAYTHPATAYLFRRTS